MDFGLVEAAYAAGGILNAGFEEPVGGAGDGECQGQIVRVTFGVQRTVSRTNREVSKVASENFDDRTAL